MPKVKLLVRGLFFPLPNEYEEFTWEIESVNVDKCWKVLEKRYLQHLKNRVPFVVEGHSRVATLDIEVFVCD